MGRQGLGSSPTTASTGTDTRTGSGTPVRDAATTSGPAGPVTETSETVATAYR